MLSLIIPLFLPIVYGADNLEYVSYSKSFQDAREYCKVIFGTDLASIVDDDDRNEAISIIPGGIDDVWIGLYSRSEGGKFRFTNGDECPMTDSVFRCVDFWSYKLNENTEERPRCIGDSEGGTQCATFDASQNSVDNDIGCQELKPFLCEARVNTPSYNGEYVYVPARTPNQWTFMDAQAHCESEYGTDLATVLTQDDLTAVENVIYDNAADVILWGHYVIIGLNDIKVEGMF